MSAPRICPECGSDIYRASHYDDLAAARRRFQQKTEQQAMEILRLQLRVAELEDERRTRAGKVERQRRTIRRLEDRLRGLGLFPHEERKADEGDPASPSPAFSTTADPLGPLDDPDYENPRGIRKMRKAAEEARAGSPKEKQP